MEMHPSIHTCIHNQEVTELPYFISEPVMELRSEADKRSARCYRAGIEFQRDAPAKEKLV